MASVLELGTVVTEAELLHAAKAALLEDIKRPLSDDHHSRGALIEPEADRQTLVAFFAARDPDKLPLVGQILDRFKGKEPTMYEHLIQQYSVSRTNVYRDDIIKFYEKYNPSRICAVDLIVDLYQGQEEQLMFLLVNKYIRTSPLRIWCRYVDSATGREYFHNRITQEVQWETPEGGYLVEPERNVIHPIKAPARTRPLPPPPAAPTPVGVRAPVPRRPSDPASFIAGLGGFGPLGRATDTGASSGLSDAPRAPSVPVRHGPFAVADPTPQGSPVRPQVFYNVPGATVFNEPERHAMHTHTAPPNATAVSPQRASPRRMPAVVQTAPVKGGDGPTGSSSAGDVSPGSLRRHHERLINHEREEVLRLVMQSGSLQGDADVLPDYQVPLHPKKPLATKSANGGVPGQEYGLVASDTEPCLCDACHTVCHGFEELAAHKEREDHGQWFVCGLLDCPLHFPSQLSLLLHRLQVHKAQGAALTTAPS